MTTTSPAISNSTDLVLQLVGGDRNGHLLPVSTAKCLLSSLIVDKVEAEKYRCAIFRGEKGVAFRSYSELVLVNGNKTSVQWLKEGDTIQLTPEMQVVVKHLGSFTPTKAPSTPKAPLPAARQGENTISLAPAADQGTPASGEAVNLASVNSKPAVTPVSNETQIKPTSDRKVGQRMDVLSDQLTSLVDAASNSGAVPATTQLQNEATPETPAEKPLSDQKMADASSSIQDYLDKALAATGTSSIAPPTPTPQTPTPQTPAVAMTTPESRDNEATLEFAATSDAAPAASSPESASKLREEAVTSSLNRLLSGTEVGPVGQERVVQPTAITAQDQDSQASATAKSDSVLLPNPSQPTTLEASEAIAAETVSPTAPPVAATPVATPPAATESVEATAPAEAPKAQSLEFLKSLGINAEGLGLDNPTPTAENTAPTTTQPTPDAPRESTPSAVLPTADEIIASASMGSALPTTELVAEEETPEPVAAPKKAESVADVLARMQNAGSLDSFSMDGPAEEASPEPVSVPTEVVTPKPQVSETVVAEASTESKSEGDEDSSVEDYMSQLLNRMRGGEDSKVVEDKGSDDEKSAPQEEVSEETEIVETSVEELPQQTLTAEQFVPKEKAVRMKSFDSLREIANNSNRSAIQDHLANQRKIATQTKMQLALISLGFGVLFFLMSWVFSSEVSVGGVFCGIVFLTCGVIFAKFCRDEQKLDESIIKAQKAKA